VAGRELVTRTTLSRALVANAVTKPVAIAVPAAVLVAALLLSTWWLVPIAIAVYLALVASTLLDGDEAELVGKGVYARGRGPRPLPGGLDPELRALRERARGGEARVRTAIAASDPGFADVSAEVDWLTAELERSVARAQTIVDYLAGQRPEELRRRRESLGQGRRGAGPEVERARERAVAAIDAQLAVRASLEGELDRFRSEMEHLIASLGVVHGHLVRIGLADEAPQREALADEVRDLRDRVGALADALGDAVDRAR
jgi:hypothetical protein